MMPNLIKKLSIPALLLSVTLACSTLAPVAPQPVETLNALYTSVAATLDSLSTPTETPYIGEPTATPFLSFPTTSSTPFIVNTITSVPPTQTAIKCDAAAFVADVTITDGALIGRGSDFTKIWRLKNVGTCTWTTSYAIVYVSGEKFGASNVIPLTAQVVPGQTVDIAINFTAPNAAGRYRGNWKLRNSSGALFGVGPDAQTNFYVDVNVSGYTLSAYDFVVNYCDATWKSETKNLGCPGSQGDDRGFVRALKEPTMEDGATRGNGLLTYPNKSGSGLISGKFPNFIVRNGDRFQALIGCQYGAKGCDVIFRLQYQIGNGDVKTLGQWHEAYEGLYYPVNVDLSALRDQKVKFILTVLANGSSHDDFALWVNPRITRQSANPATLTPSRTPTASRTATASRTPTASRTATASRTPTASRTATASRTPTASSTATASQTPTATPTETETPSPSDTPEPSATPTQ